jgi:hypothetical protein
MNICGWLARYECNDVVPDFMAPITNKFGRDLITGKTGSMLSLLDYWPEGERTTIGTLAAPTAFFLVSLQSSVEREADLPTAVAYLAKSA